jgi:chemosensory pili system protein ChpA (sensor histidine kinase/response regulator)
MADNRQYTALEWVIKEINETLQESQRVLERYADDPQDVTQLRFCQTLIHQVYGSLHMVGFHGAAMLAEEMESLVLSLLESKNIDFNAALETLMRSIIQLPNYLEQVQQTKRDYPAVILSLLNDIRSVRGASLLSETTLFRPNLDYAHKVRGEPHPLSQNSTQFKALITKLRKMYQYAASSVINDINTDENIVYLLKVSDRTRKVLYGTKRYALWEIANTLFLGLKNKVISPSTTVKQTLKELHRELGVMATNGSVSLSAFPDDELIKKLLYCLNVSNSNSPEIERLKKHYELDRLMPSISSEDNKEDIPPVDAGTMRAVASAIQDEFGQIKTRLDGCLQGEEPGENLDFIQNGLQRINDTLSILGVNSLRQEVNRCIVTIASIRHKSEDVDAERLLNVAEYIADIETKLDAALSKSEHSQNSYHLDSAQTAVVEECRNGLERAKDAIVDYIAAQWDITQLERVPENLREVRGNLSMLTLDRAADILSGCIVYIESQLIEQKVRPKWQQLDSLADVIASVDYYLEFMSAAKENDETILQKAEKGLDLLGAAKASVESISSPETTDESPAVTQTQTEVPSTPVESGHAEAEEDDIDAEVVEIFIEETKEIRERLDEHFPQWSNNFDNETALTETRRAFHTLKGSGRMVKASEIGELAWSIENMLNRIMDKTIAADKAQVLLIEKVLKILPDMVDAYENRLQNPHHELTEKYQELAHLISRSEQPQDVIGQLLDEGTAALEDTDPEEIDTQLWEIFQSEAETHLAVVDEYIDTMEKVKPFYEPPSDAMQRALHTLKGSAHMAELTPIASLMTPLEKFAKELRSYQVNIDDDIFQLIKDGVLYTQEALTQIEKVQYPVIPKLDQFIARVEELRERTVGPLIRQKEAEEAQKQVDPAVLEVLMAEEMNLLLDADLHIQEWSERPATVEDWQPLHDELATLCHGAERANLPSMANLSRALQSTYQQLMDGNIAASTANYGVMLEGHNQLMDVIDAVAAGQDLPIENSELLDRLANLEPIQQAPEALETPVQIESELANERQTDEAPEIESALTETSDSANEGFDASESLEPKTSVEEEADPESLETNDVSTHQAEEQLLEEQLIDATDESPNIEAGRVDDEQEQVSETDFSAAEEADTEILESFQPKALHSDFEQTLNAVPQTPEDWDELDKDTVEIFLEEAHDLLEELDESIHNWENGSDDRESNETMQRSLHTFKGGARLAGLIQLGDISHEFETFLINSLKSEQTDDIFDQLHQFQDQMIRHVNFVEGLMNPEQVSTETSPETLSGNEEDKVAEPTDLQSSDEESQQSSPSSEPDAKPEKTAAFGSSSTSNVVPFTGTTTAKASGLKILKETPSAPKPNPGQQTAAARRSQPQEMVKVSADLMEDLVNLAGETSISRGRMEEQINELGHSLDEMGMTVQRLQEQLRRLDIETEAQILFRQEQMEESDDFDPLEMDRYSQLQQLSRSLIESASDLMDLKGTLSDKTRDAETVLLQQSRINTDLQEGLMRSRMVPFSRIVPRLRRIVRQISMEVDKDVNLELGNIEGELDRSMMERMVAPLEHMLRNAIDHGIEDTETRERLAKPPTGRIIITMDRDGGDVLIHVADDGQGIDVARVREKAIERNLMNPDSALSDQEILQFILHAGFSTAETVTQISGRGVGMDVVNSEIRQMGGRVTIDSRSGEGTAFTIRVPFTVSVNRALMISMGDDRYAIPLNTIEGIVRISPYELEHYYSNPDEPFEYAGQEYQLRYLGTLLDQTVAPRLHGHTLPLPVLLVRSADHSVALQVDHLHGSREIVVKSLGPQFRSVLGVSGATIMGDGHVVVILDSNALIRSSIARNIPQIIQASPEQDANRASLVMVVDDSVTVRKVTSRLLEREGYDVITAKDGVDAMMTLQDHTPDIMLLDIEMPRMDGFEVAKNVRSSTVFNKLPIIMITSRTGEKHRQRGLEAGANLYVGKPYQEEQLLENIRSLIGANKHDGG